MNDKATALILGLIFHFLKTYLLSTSCYILWSSSFAYQQPHLLFSIPLFSLISYCRHHMLLYFHLIHIQHVFVSCGFYEMIFSFSSLFCSTPVPSRVAWCIADAQLIFAKWTSSSCFHFYDDVRIFSRNYGRPTTECTALNMTSLKGLI